MKRYFFLVLLSLVLLAFLSACSQSPSSSAIQTAIAQTQEPQETVTSLPAEIPTPVATPKPKVSCPQDEVKKYLDDLDALLEEFDDTVTIAESTSRIGLAPVIQTMQSQKRSIARLNAPDCAKYLTDMVVVAVETKIDAFLSFMSQASDTSISRKLKVADEARITVNGQIEAFRKDPLSAYETATIDAAKLVEGTLKPEPFVRPADWIDVDIPASGGLVLSIPQSWTSSTYGDESEYIRLQNGDQTLTVLGGYFSNEGLSSASSDAARLFALQTMLETEDSDFYSEHSAEVGVYALNKGYVVNFARRQFSFGEITDNQWAQIVTPDVVSVFLMAETTRDEFARIDLLEIDQVYSSIRKKE